MNEIKHDTETAKLESGLKRLKERLDRTLPQQEMVPEELTRRKAELSARIIETLKDSPDACETVIPSFTGAYETMMREQKQHLDKYREYERKANNIEADVRRGKLPAEKMKEARKYHRMAEAEKQEAEKVRQEAKKILFFRGDSQSEVSFAGGLGVSEMKHIRGSGKISDARNKRSEASSLENQAGKAEWEGKSQKAADLRSRASSLRHEAAALEKEGKKLIKESKK